MPAASPRIETFFLPGPAGRLECILKHPLAECVGETVGAAAVVCHPHPMFGGTMHNKVVHAAAEAIVREGLPAMRFNFRGTGGSGGRHDGGRGEQEDLAAVLDHLAGRYPGRPLLVAGYSFGAYVGLRVGCRDPRVAALVSIGTPLALYGFGFLRECGKPLSFIQGEMDPIGPLGLVLALAAVPPGGCRVMAVPGATHAFADRLDDLGARVAEAIPPEMIGPTG
ncbi:MAG: alpha/beta hydrolase [Acidobacteriota bacterium]